MADESEVKPEMKPDSDAGGTPGKKKRRKLWIKIISMCLILAGIVVIGYPIATSLYNKYMQKQLKEEFYRLVEANKKKEPKETVELKNDLNIDDDSTLNHGIDVDKILEEDKNAKSDEKNPAADKNEQEVKNAQVVEEQLGTQDIIGLITIESLGIEYVIVEGTDSANINAAVGHLSKTKPLGQKGNCAIAGHRGGRYGEFFMNLNQLPNGANIIVKDLGGNVYTYVSYEKKTIKPNETEVIEDIKDESTLTLISCEDHGTKRIIVHAKLVSQTKE